jgi:hypothetical protein
MECRTAYFAPDFATATHVHERAYCCVVLGGVSVQRAGPIERRRDRGRVYFYPAGPQKDSSELRWLLPILELAANGPAKADAPPVAGKYKGVEITSDAKFIGASGVPRELTPLSDGTFLIEDASVAARYRARVRFTETGLELLTRQGRVLPRPRLPQ